MTGLRAVYSANEWSEKQWSEWNSKHYRQLPLGSEEKLRAAADVAERNLDVIGATAIEDRLQEGVPETIATAAAEIMESDGGQSEAAIEIARSCRLIVEDMPVDVLASDVAEQTLVADLCQLREEVTRDQYEEAKGLAPFSLKLKRYAKTTSTARTRL